MTTPQATKDQGKSSDDEYEGEKNQKMLEEGSGDVFEKNLKFETKNEPSTCRQNKYKMKKHMSTRILNNLIGESDDCHQGYDEKKKGYDREEQIVREAPSQKIERDSSSNFVCYRAAKKLMGDNYDRHEVKFAFFALVLIALNTGFMNGTCMSGHLFESDNQLIPYHKQHQMIAGYAGAITKTAYGLTISDWDGFEYHSFMVLSYMLGAFISGIMSPFATPYTIEPHFGPSLFIGFLCLLIASLLAFNDKYADDKYAAYMFYLVVCANGIQQAVASIYSANLIRCTITGAVTDIALVIGQALRGQYKGIERGIILSIMIFFYWLGSLLGHFAAPRLKGYTLMFSAALFLICAVSFPVFLFFQLGIDMHQAVLGTWKWNEVAKVMKSIVKEDGVQITKQGFFDLFDEIDADHTGEIDTDELIEGLKKLCLKLSPYEMQSIFRFIDKNGDGRIDRNEWTEEVAKLFD